MQNLKYFVSIIQLFAAKFGDYMWSLNRKGIAIIKTTRLKQTSVSLTNEIGLVIPGPQRNISILNILNIPIFSSVVMAAMEVFLMISSFLVLLQKILVIYW